MSLTARISAGFAAMTLLFGATGALNAKEFIKDPRARRGAIPWP
jgi:hypothetical protein